MTAKKADTRVRRKQGSADTHGKGQGGKARPSLLSAQETHELLARLREANPNPRSELFWTNPYTLLVAVVLSAQSTDKGVNKVTEHLFREVDTPEKMLELGEEALRERIRSIGLYPTKAKNIIRLSEILLREHGGKVPRRREELVKLPGVGRKTANVVLNVAFGEPTIAVDTHIFRVANRTGLAPGRTPEEVERHLEQVVPDEFKLHVHHWLILHGRYVCTARRPKCETCVICDICRWEEKGECPAMPFAVAQE